MLGPPLFGVASETKSKRFKKSVFYNVEINGHLDYMYGVGQNKRNP